MLSGPPFAFAKPEYASPSFALPPDMLGMLGKCLAGCHCCRCCSRRFRLVHGVASRFVPVVGVGERVTKVQSLGRKLGMARYISTKC